jgi:predicted SAM-dependent methyltransferase
LKLNLGCGNNYEKGWINADISKKVKADNYFDFGKDKFPFKDNQFSEIKAEMVFEHLPDYFARVHFLKEIYRVGKKNCIIFLSMPHFSSHGAWNDLQHSRPFGSMSLDYFAVNKTHKHSIMHDQEIDGDNNLFFVKPKIVFGKLYTIIPISFFANWSKTRLIYEMFFAYIFPARDLHFELKVIK